jgi:hypothetical protein
MIRIVRGIVFIFAVLVAVHAGAAEQTLSLFVGVTDDRGDDVFSLGLDYEYKFSEVFGIGGLLDHANGDVRTWVVGVPIFAHPVGGLVVLLAPGVEHQNDGDNEALVLGDRFVVTPIVNVDFVDGDKVYVYGVEFGHKLGGD